MLREQMKVSNILIDYENIEVFLSFVSRNIDQVKEL